MNKWRRSDQLFHRNESQTAGEAVWYEIHAGD